MSKAVKVGLKMLAIADKRQFAWERAEEAMCYQVKIATCTVLVSENGFRILNDSGDELDVVHSHFGGNDGWIHRLWRGAHLAVLEQENVFGELLQALDELDSPSEEQD